MTKNTVTIPAALIPELEAWAKSTAQLFERLRHEAGLRSSGVSADQAWFWTDKWQTGEREADDALARGDYKDFDSAEDLLADLHAHV